MKQNRINLRIPESLEIEAKKKAQSLKITFSEFIRDAMKEKLWRAKWWIADQ